MEYDKGALPANLIRAREKRTTSFTVKKPIISFSDPDWSSKRHVWRMDWDENRMVIPVDGEALNDADLTKTFNPDGTNPNRHAHFILLNVATGGQAGGDPSATAFPPRMEVDYVRVYQK